MRRLCVLAAVVAAALSLAALSAAAPVAQGCTPTAQDAFGPFGRGTPPFRTSIGPPSMTSQDTRSG